MMLSKYEMTMALSLRTEQLRRGMDPRTVPTTSHFDPLALAVKELEEGVIPFEIVRAKNASVSLQGRMLSDGEKRMLQRLMNNMRHHHRCCLDAKDK